MTQPSFLSKLTALVKLTRPNNVGLIIVAVMAGAALGLPPLACPTAGLKQIFSPLLFSALALSLVAIGGYAVNDLLDRKSDKISHPKRPLVNGAFNHPAAVAITVTIVSWLGALALSWFVAGGEFWIIVGCLVLSFVYALWLKRAGIFGNLTVALMTSLALAYGATVIHALQAILPLIILAFLTNLARELYKDVEDAEGDRELNSRSLPLTIGEKPTRIIGSVIAFTVAPALLYFHLTGMLFWLDTLSLVAGLAIPLIIIAIIGIKKPEKVGKVQRWMKESMFSALLVLLLGRLIFRVILSGQWF